MRNPPVSWLGSFGPKRAYVVAWSQTLGTVHAYIDVPQDWKRKDIRRTLRAQGFRYIQVSYDLRLLARERGARESVP